MLRTYRNRFPSGVVKANVKWNSFNGNRTFHEKRKIFIRKIKSKYEVER